MDNEVIEILEQGTIEGNIFKLPSIQLERKLYEKVSKAIAGVNGKWNKKQGGFVFEHDEVEHFIERLKSGEKINLKKDFQMFFTPENVADYVVSNYLYGYTKSEISKMDILEPSAGQGSLIKSFRKEYPNAKFFAVEMEDSNRAILSKMENVILSPIKDFLSVPEHFKFDLIIANPPFSKNQDIDHIMKMYRMLKRDGVLLSFSSNHWEIGQEPKCVAFKKFLDAAEAEIYKIPKGQFKESGTMIGTTLFLIRKLE